MNQKMDRTVQLLYLFDGMLGLYIIQIFQFMLLQRVFRLLFQIQVFVHPYQVLLDLDYSLLSSFYKDYSR